MLIRRDRNMARTGAGEMSSDAAVRGDATDGASTLVYILGIGFMIYVGLEFVLPALFGATAKTRNAYKRMRSDGTEATTPPHRSFSVPPSYSSNPYGSNPYNR